LNTDDIKEAVVLLVQAENYAALKKALQDIISTRETLPRRFSGALSPLNELIVLEKKSEAAYANVIELVESKRRASPAVGKVDYQRDYMRQRRARLATALKIEELERGIRLSPTARENFTKAQMDKWMKARDAFISAKGDLGWKERNDAAAEFWSQIDQQLERRLADAQVARRK